jgi:hypothetical protein
MAEKQPIVRLSADRGGLLPVAMETLSLDFETELFNLEYHLRHPYGIYNNSLSRVFSRFRDFLDQLTNVGRIDVLADKSNTQWNTRLLSSLELLLFSLMEHMDDCENILRCFFSPTINLANENCFKGYQSEVNTYRTHIGKVVNLIKHKQGRLRTIGMITEEAITMGYFVEGVADDGSLGPSQIIHKNGSTAFSFSRNIRYHLYNLFFVSEILSKVIYIKSKPK